MRNARWFCHYTAQSNAIESHIDEIIKPIEQIEKIYNSSGLEYTHDSWAIVYDYLEDHKEMEKFFKNTIRHDIVFGFELSRAQKRLLNKLGVTFLDFRTHPVRFLTDYHLAVSTNSQDIHNRLTQTQPSQSYIELHAQFARARAAHRYHRRMNPSHGLVFFGQTAIDSSRIRDGRIVDDIFILSKVRATIEKLGPRNFYYKSHPHENLDPYFESKLKSLGGRRTNTNTYDLLSVDKLRFVTLSSSVFFESKYFNCFGEKLIDDLENYPQPNENSEVGDYLFCPTNIFSKQMIEYLIRNRKPPHSVYPLPETPYKESIRVRWG